MIWFDFDFDSPLFWLIWHTGCWQLLKIINSQVFWRREEVQDRYIELMRFCDFVYKWWSDGVMSILSSGAADYIILVVAPSKLNNFG